MIKGLMVVAALALAILTIGLVLVARAQAPFLYILPPLEYDRPYIGELTIDTAKDSKEVQAVCQLPTQRVACSYAGGRWCRIIKISDDALRAMGWNPIHIMRHEHAHCNGWTNKHEGMRPAIAANDLNWRYDHRDLYRATRPNTSAVIPELTKPPPQ